MTKGDSKRVIPLESNPSLFTELAYQLGLSPILQFHDVYSLTDPDLLAMLPTPIYAIILLFSLSPNYEKYRQQQDNNNNNNFNSTNLIKYDNNNDIEWFKQTIGNGCGLYALLHILTNLPQDLIISNSKLSQLRNNLTKVKEFSIDDRAKIIENLENDIKLDENFGEKGDTKAPDINESVDLHFISFIKSTKNGHLYELDGRRTGPIDLGESNNKDNNNNNNNIINDPLLIEKIQFYIDNADEANKNNFAIMAIGPSFD